MKPNKTYSRSFILTAALAAVFALAAAGPCAAEQPNSTPIDLGLLPGTTGISGAVAVNASGQVVGVSGSLPFIWQKGVMTQLPVSSGTESCTPMAINASGQVVGYCTMTSTQGGQAFLWTPGRRGWTVTALGFPEGFTVTAGLAINDAGQVLAEAQAAIASSTMAACVWKGGVWTVLKKDDGTLIDNVPNRQFRWQINQKGQVLGVDATSHLVLWENGTVTPLGIIDPAWAFLNNNGQVVGVSLGEFEYEEYDFYIDVASGAGTSRLVWDFLGNPGVGYYFEGLNDSGQILIGSVDPIGMPGTTYTALGIVDWNDVFSSPAVFNLGTLPGKGVRPGNGNVLLNANGEVSGFWPSDVDNTEAGAFYASLSAGIVTLDGLPGATPALFAVIGMNDSGTIVGTTDTADLDFHPVLWTAGLKVGTAAVSSKGRTITVTVPVTNRNSVLTANAVTITSASLDGGTLTTALPLAVKSVAPGATVSVTLKFSVTGMSTGQQPLTVGGTSSLGDFTGTQTVTVP